MKAMKMRYACFVVIMIAALVQLGTQRDCYGNEEKIVLTWSDYASPGFDQLNYVRHYINRISEETNGRVEIKLYPAQQLVKAKQQYEAMMNGTIDMCNFTPVYYAGKIPLLILTSEITYWKPGDSVVITSRTADKIDKILNRDGIKFMGWSTELPPMCIVGNKIFKEPGDFKGTKVRAPGKATKMIKKWGGTGVSITASETYMALQTGVVDCAFTSIGSVAGGRLWDVASSITLMNTGGSPQLICMNMEKWNSLPADIKKIFNKVNREMVPWAYDHALTYTAKTGKNLETKFDNTYRHTPEESKELNQVIQGLFWKPVVKRGGEPAEKFWNEILEIVDECKNNRIQGNPPEFFK